MATSVAIVLVTWLAVSVVVVVGFAVGSALGYRRGFEDGQRLADPDRRQRTLRLERSRRSIDVPHAAGQ
jgi:hypothetical protein